MTGFLLMAVSAWLLFLFVKHESKEKYPVFNISLIKVNKTFRRASLAALINYASTFPSSSATKPLRPKKALT
jgi:hypothetical protein